MTPLFVSYFTPDYAERAAVLRASLRKFKLDFEVDPVPDRGTWQQNSGPKPLFIWKKMAAHPGRPLVWIDADAKVVGEPTLLLDLAKADLADVAAAEYRWKDGSRQELLSGTVYVHGNVRSARLVDRWIGFHQEDPDNWDQRTLRKAVEAMGDKVRMHYLPLEYCFIFDSHHEAFPQMIPVVLHYQESRKARVRKG